LNLTRQKYKAILQFIFLFCCFTLLGAFGLFYAEESTLIRELGIVYAQATGVGLSWLGYQVSVTKSLVVVHHFSMNIAPECTGLQPLLIFFSCVLAFPARAKFKIVGLVLSMPLFFLVNVVRLVVLGVLGVYNEEIFRIFHYYLWQIIFILIAVSAWLLWLEWFIRCEQKEREKKDR